MNASVVLFGANIATWLEIIFAVVLAVVYIFNHLIAAAAKQQRRQMRPEARPDARGPRPGGKPEVQDEVAEFLKRAAEKRSAAKTAEARPAQARQVQERRGIRPLAEEVDPRILEMRAAAQKRQAANRSAAPVSAEIVEARAVEPLSSSRGPRPVQSHLDTRELADRAGHLTHVERAETAFQAHMQSLDHQVGRIADVATGEPAAGATTTPPTLPATPSDFFTGLLSDPQSLRQAIILNEIMERPVERW